MASAWNQVIGVEAANRALRLAQLAKHVGRVAAPAATSPRFSDAAVVIGHRAGARQGAATPARGPSGPRSTTSSLPPR